MWWGAYVGFRMVAGAKEVEGKREGAIMKHRDISRASFGHRGGHCRDKEEELSPLSLLLSSSQLVKIHIEPTVMDETF